MGVCYIGLDRSHECMHVCVVFMGISCVVCVKQERGVGPNQGESIQEGGGLFFHTVAIDDRIGSVPSALPRSLISRPQTVDCRDDRTI